MNKKTLVLGASTNPNRYSNIAVKKLVNNGINVVAIGKKKGKIGDVEILNFKKKFESIDTVTMYLNKHNQIEYYKYILKLNPKRVIFNPGTENEYFENLLRQNNIYFEHSCTLVLLIGKY